eukprot:scaffold498_cov363-Pavlova_lutheri.AAC.1
MCSLHTKPPQPYTKGPVGSQQAQYGVNFAPCAEWDPRDLPQLPSPAVLDASKAAHLAVRC